MMDRNGNGKIETRDLGVLIRAMGENPSNEEVQALIELVDKEHGGEIEFNALMELIKQGFKPIDKEDLLAIFRAIDTEATGKIRKEDVTNVVATSGEELTPQEANEIFEDFADPEGFIAYEEFVEKLLAK